MDERFTAEVTVREFQSGGHQFRHVQVDVFDAATGLTWVHPVAYGLEGMGGEQVEALKGRCIERTRQQTGAP